MRWPWVKCLLLLLGAAVCIGVACCVQLKQRSVWAQPLFETVRTAPPLTEQAPPYSYAGACEQHIPKAKQPRKGRCVFIDTNVRQCCSLVWFHTFTVFQQSTCAWEAWFFGPPMQQKHGTIPLLAKIPGVTLRHFGAMAQAPEKDAPTLVDVKSPDVEDLQNPDNTDLAGMIKSNLAETDYIVVTLHGKVHAEVAVKLVESLAENGVATWVDKWLIHYHSRETPVLHELRNTLLSRVPGLVSPTLPQWLRLLVHNPRDKGVTEMAWRADAAAAAKQSAYFPPPPAGRNIFVDLGTNTGDTIWQFLTFVPDPQNWEVWGMEADAIIAQSAIQVSKWLEDNYPLSSPKNSLFHIYSNAVWTENSILEFHPGKSVGSGAGSLFNGVAAAGPVVRVEAINVIEWMRSHFKESDFIFLKMDVAGAEYPVLPLMAEDGVICWPKKWAMQWHTDLTNKSQAGVSLDVENMLLRRGVEFTRLR